MENIKTIEQTLTTAIFEVFERMFFVFAEPLRDEAPPAFQWRTTIRFQGPFSGRMRLDVTSTLARALAMNMLNMEREEITEPVLADCLKESLNMICGNFLRHVDPAHGVVLSIPVCEPLPVPGVGGETPRETAVRLAFATDDGAFGIELTRDDHLETD